MREREKEKGKVLQQNRVAMHNGRVVSKLRTARDNGLRSERARAYASASLRALYRVAGIETRIVLTGDGSKQYVSVFSIEHRVLINKYSKSMHGKIYRASSSLPREMSNQIA